MVVQLDFYWQSKFNQSLWFWPFCCVTQGLKALGCRGKVYNMELEMGPLKTISLLTEGQSWPQLTKGKTPFHSTYKSQWTVAAHCQKVVNTTTGTNRSNSCAHSRKQTRQILDRVSEIYAIFYWLNQDQVTLTSTWSPVVGLVQFIFY